MKIIIQKASIHCRAQKRVVGNRMMESQKVMFEKTSIQNMSGKIAQSRVDSLDGVVDSLGRVVDSLDGIVDSLGS